MSVMFGKATRDWIDSLGEEQDRLLAAAEAGKGAAVASIAAVLADEPKQLYQAALTEITQACPELRGLVMEMWGLRDSLFRAVRDSTSRQSVTSFALQLAKATQSLGVQLPSVDAAPLSQASDVSPKQEPEEQISPCARAIFFMYDRFKITGKIPPKEKIAKAACVHRGTLRRSKQFQAWRDAHSALRRTGKVSKGSKDRNGDIEAVDD
jgi:hypothetical protein